MSQLTILVIDDSATIRRLVDGTLSPEGYRVILASSAEEGLAQARSVRPDLILLDHQLPGTTGFEVCKKLLEIPEVQHTPVVVSSTLRKKAYVEYTDSPNVVDMLPKPYSEELLITTVANALDTGRLIVQSQSDGTAIPEVINALAESDLAGTFKSFSLREVLDFVNNGGKSGVLEVQAGTSRIWFYVDDGRLQAVMGTGVDPREVVKTLPASLRDLAPVLNLTVGGKLCSEVDGLVELLDRKVLDPRLLRQVLRHQAAMLVWKCFQGELQGFRFEAGRAASPLFRKLPLDSSLAALLVEAALRCGAQDLPEDTPHTVYVRRSIRGQNLDRAGLTPDQLKVFGGVNEPVSAVDLADRCGRDTEETRRILLGLCMAELVDRQIQGVVVHVVALESDPGAARTLRSAFGLKESRFAAKIVRDQLAVQLLLKRSRPQVLVVPFDTERERQFAENVRKQVHSKRIEMKLVGILAADADERSGSAAAEVFDATVTRPYTADQILEALDDALASSSEPTPSPAAKKTSFAACVS
ncbi:MAG: response regulator [Planctomycetaceae bacterium]